MADSNVKFVLYHYSPSLPAAIVFTILFGVSAAWHTYTLSRQRTWYFIPFVIGCLFETIGYVGRAISATEAPNFTLNPYIIQSVLLLLAPALLAASIYMVLGRIIVILDAEQHAIIPAKWLTKFFVCGDVLSFLAQSSGGALLAKAKSLSDVSMGEHIILGGLGIQILFFGFFMVTTLIFDMRIRKQPTTVSLSINTPWRPLIWVLYLTSILIMVRSIYRVAEYVTGRSGAIQAHEYWIYIFDASLMLIVTLVLNWYHPSKVVNRNVQTHTMPSAEVLEGGYHMEQQHPDKHSRV